MGRYKRGLIKSSRKRRKMKILLASDWYIPQVNGVVTSVVNLKKGLEELGHEVRVLTLARSIKSKVEGDVTYLGSYNAGWIYSGARIKTVMTSRLVDDLRAWRPDVIHTNCEFSTFTVARKLANELGVPLIHTYHTVYEEYTHYFFKKGAYIGNKALPRWTRWISNKTQGFIAPTEKVHDLLRSYKVTKPIFVIPTGIDLSRFSEEPAGEERAELLSSLGIPEGNTVLVHVGRLAGEKNTEELIRGFSAFKGGPVSFVIVGDGPVKSDLEDLVLSLDMRDQIIFTGMVSPEVVGKYYHLGELFLCASTTETQGLTYMEALAAGLPLLCRKDPCLDGVVKEGLNGWQYEDLPQFEEYLSVFLADKELRRAMRKSALASADEFSIQKFAKRVELAYRQLDSRRIPAVSRLKTRVRENLVIKRLSKPIAAIRSAGERKMSLGLEAVGKGGQSGGYGND